MRQIIITGTMGRVAISDDTYRIPDRWENRLECMKRLVREAEREFDSSWGRCGQTFDAEAWVRSLPEINLATFALRAGVVDVDGLDGLRMYLDRGEADAEIAKRAAPCGKCGREDAIVTRWTSTDHLAVSVMCPKCLETGPFASGSEEAVTAWNEGKERA